MITAAEGLDLSGEMWSKACLRMGNVIALAVRATAMLPLEPSDSAVLVSGLRKRAAAMYERAKAFPALADLAAKNEAKMEHWARPEGAP